MIVFVFLSFSSKLILLSYIKLYFHLLGAHRSTCLKKKLFEMIGHIINLFLNFKNRKCFPQDPQPDEPDRCALSSSVPTDY